jgi:archaellum component FlaC
MREPLETSTLDRQQIQKAIEQSIEPLCQAVHGLGEQVEDLQMEIERLERKMEKMEDLQMEIERLERKIQYMSEFNYPQPNTDD